MKNINIAIIGYGTVAKGVVELLKNNSSIIEKNNRVKINLKRILIRKKREESIFTTDYNDILNDETIDIVLELTSAKIEAFNYIVKALKSKKHVVSANKYIIARKKVEIFNEAKRNNKKFKFEASVCGAIPVIKTINEAMSQNRIESIEGIFNGTTNFILTKMKNENMTYLDALKKAQELGYAEADPTADVEGYDSSNKLSILVYLAFGLDIHPKNIKTKGITEVKIEKGKNIKLIAKAYKKENDLVMSVEPTFIDEKHMLSNVEDSFNAVIIKTDNTDELMLYGRGAGSLPTASAVISDVLDIAREYEV